MSTDLQKNLAKEIIANAARRSKKNKGELVELGGYSKTVAIAKPQAIIDQKGVQEELAIAGFTEKNAKTVVSEILLNKKVKPDTRLNAAKEVFKVEGSYAPEKSQTLRVNINATDAGKKLTVLAVRVREQMRKELTQKIYERNTRKASRGSD